MREFVEYLAKQLVDHPEKVNVSDEEKEGKLVFKLKVDESDVGKIIGKKGRTAQSIRILLNAAAAKQGRRAILEVLD